MRRIRVGDTVTWMGDSIEDTVTGVLLRQPGLEPLVRRARPPHDWWPQSNFRIVRRARLGLTKRGWR